MRTALTIFQLILSLFVIGFIFLQRSTESQSSSRIMSQTAPTKRGWEKLSFQISIILVILFLSSSIAQVVIFK